METSNKRDRRDKGKGGQGETLAKVDKQLQGIVLIVSRDSDGHGGHRHERGKLCQGRGICGTNLGSRGV